MNVKGSCSADASMPLHGKPAGHDGSVYAMLVPDCCCALSIRQRGMPQLTSIGVESQFCADSFRAQV